MINVDFDMLYKRADEVRKHRQLTEYANCGYVSAALLSASGSVYVGVNIDAACGVGFCAEHAAAAQMLTAGESAVAAMLAIDHDGSVLPPCGRCREFILQLDDANGACEVLVAPGEAVPLTALMPYYWRTSRSDTSKG